MNIAFDIEATNAAFAQPYCDGSFDPDFLDYLNELGRTRPSVVLAFAPKAAGTFLRAAAVVATGGAFVRTVHAQGGRDASFYLPTFLSYYAGGVPARPMVTHVHMQALPANKHFITALDLKPVVMIRPIPDMLTSYWDMLAADHHAPDNWLNLRVPPEFGAMDETTKGDFMIDMFGPWYASYFSTWAEFAQEAPERVCILHYDRFLSDPVGELERMLAHAGLPRSTAQCQLAIDTVWEDRGEFRFNQGFAGRGLQRFSAAQIARLERLLDFYPNLTAIRATLIPPLSVSEPGPEPSAISAAL